MEQKVATIKHPNPNNPMEYCSTVPPLQQVTDSKNHPVPSVLVPVSVLKREGKFEYTISNLFLCTTNAKTKKPKYAFKINFE